MRYEAKSHVKFLRPFFALLLLAAFAALASPTFAQIRSNCAATFTTSSGAQLNLYLDATVDPLTGKCKPDNDARPRQPGDVVPGCYHGTERTQDGYTLNHLTDCTVCAEGQPGCNVYLPPAGPPPPIIVDPSIMLPPIHAFYDPYGSGSPYDPYNPMHPYDPWDPWWPSCISPYPEWYYLD